MDCDVLVVGGGPIGSAVARDIAKKDYKVMVLEEDNEIGKPVQCAGIVSPKLISLANVSDEIVLNELKSAYIHTISGKKLFIGDDEVRAVVIDREKFDKQLAKQAISSGVEYIIGAEAIGIDGRKKTTSQISKTSYIPKNDINKDYLTIKFLQNGKEETIKTKLLIGADSVDSDVAKWFDLEGPKEIIYGLISEISLDMYNENSVHLIISRSYIPGFFAWLIPINNKRIRFGMGITSNSNKLLKYYFNKLRKFNLKPFSNIFKNFDNNKASLGKIPLGLIKKTYSNRVMIVGDAACQVKPLTGGGLYYGLISAKRCAQVAVEALYKQDFTESFLSKYQNLWKKDIGKEIEQGLRMRNIFLNLSDDDIDELFNIFNQEKFLNIINENGDIDFPWRLVLKIITKKPHILKYLKKYALDYKLRIPNKLT